jgi:superfamily I DNA/RNA helicase
MPRQNSGPQAGFLSFPSLVISLIFSILEGVYDDYLRATFDNSESRRADIEQLSEYAGNFTDILELLQQLSLMSSTDGALRSSSPPNNQSQITNNDHEVVTLSSIHQAKGLEWKAVFLIWLVDGQFPNGRILEADDQDMLEEERRLFYVALTRAKDELYLSYPMTCPGKAQRATAGEPEILHRGCNLSPFTVSGRLPTGSRRRMECRKR